VREGSQWQTDREVAVGAFVAAVPVLLPLPPPPPGRLPSGAPPSPILFRLFACTPPPHLKVAVLELDAVQRHGIAGLFHAAHLWEAGTRRVRTGTYGSAGSYRGA
jgi:hypothetical protein